MKLKSFRIPVISSWKYAGACARPNGTFMYSNFPKAKLKALEQNQFFLGTQAFASPTDMASSGVWENILLSKTPTLDGVCGILSFIIILTICQIFLFVLLTDGKSTLYIVYDRCYCYTILNPFAHTGKYHTCGKNTIRYLNCTCKLTL